MLRPLCCGDAALRKLSAISRQGQSQSLTRTESPAKFNYSRTYAPLSRKSNYSRTYAKHRGWGCLPQNVLANNSFVFSRHVNCILNYMSYYIVGAPTISFRERTAACQQFPDRRAVCSSNFALLTVDCELPSPLTPIIPAALATAPLRIVPATAFTTTLSIHVGAPTISPSRASRSFWSAAARRRFCAVSTFARVSVSPRELEDMEGCAKLWVADAKRATAATWNFGLRATRSREPRQARKGATVPGKPSVPRMSRSSSK